MKIQGLVLWFDRRDGFGIVQDSQQNEYYVDVSVTPGRAALMRGDLVHFVPQILGGISCTGPVTLVTYK